MTAPAATPDDFLAAKQPNEVTITIALDGDTAEAFTFVAIGQTAYRDLLLEHPPTEKQRQEHKTEQKRLGVPVHKLERLAFNPDTFPPALLSASCTSHQWTADQWATVLEDDRLNVTEAGELVQGAVRAQVTRRRVDPEA